MICNSLLSLLAPSADTVETVVDERAVAEMRRNATSSPRNRQRGNPVGDLVFVSVGREAVAPQQIPQSVVRYEASDFDFVHRLPFQNCFCDCCDCRITKPTAVSVAAVWYSI